MLPVVAAKDYPAGISFEFLRFFLDVSVYNFETINKLEIEND